MGSIVVAGSGVGCGALGEVRWDASLRVWWIRTGVKGGRETVRRMCGRQEGRGQGVSVCDEER
jgi:hypothetical protein